MGYVKIEVDVEHGKVIAKYHLSCINIWKFIKVNQAQSKCLPKKQICQIFQNSFIDEQL